MSLIDDDVEIQCLLESSKWEWKMVFIILSESFVYKNEYRDHIPGSCDLELIPLRNHWPFKYPIIIDNQSIRREFEIYSQVYCIILVSIGKVADSWFLSSWRLDCHQVDASTNDSFCFDNADRLKYNKWKPICVIWIMISYIINCELTY